MESRVRVKMTVRDLTKCGTKKIGIAMPKSICPLSKSEKKMLRENFGDISMEMINAFPLYVYYEGGDMSHLAIRPAPGGSILISKDRIEYNVGELRLAFYRGPLPGEQVYAPKPKKKNWIKTFMRR